MPHIFGPMESRPFRLTLNTDGRPHPVENLLSVTTLIFGLVAFAAAFPPGAHVIASWAGAIGFFLGLYSQYVSATTPERALNVVGMVAAFIGVTLGVYHGGFMP